MGSHILSRRALSAGRLTALGARRDFHHELLTGWLCSQLTCYTSLIFCTRRLRPEIAAMVAGAEQLIGLLSGRQTGPGTLCLLTRGSALMDYGKYFTVKKFWSKVQRFAKRAGRRVLEPALVLYFCMQDDDTPAWAKGVIVSALGYFILPMDAIPDAMPAVGFGDDLGVLVVALGIVAVHIKPEHRDRATQRLREWLGDEGDDGGRITTRARVTKR